MLLKLPIDSMADNDKGADTASRFHYQYVIGAMLLLQADRENKRSFKALWCEQVEDLLCQLEDGFFEFYQVKTKVDTVRHWTMGMPALVKSISRFVKIENQYGKVTQKYIFISNCPFKQLKSTTPVNEKASSPEGFLGAIKGASSIERIDKDYKEKFNWLVEECKNTSELVFATLKKTSVQKALDFDNCESVLRDIHFVKYEYLIGTQKKAFAEKLISLISKASRAGDDSPEKHLYNSINSNEQHPDLLSKRITLDDFNKQLSEVNKLSLIPEMVTKPMRDELDELLKKAAISDELREKYLSNCVHRISPIYGVSPDSELTPEAKLDYLFERGHLLSEQDINVPALWFIYSLIPHAKNKTELQAWFKRAKHYVDAMLPDGQTVRLPNNEVTEVPKTQPYLLIEIIEQNKASKSENKRQYYQVTAWLLDSRGEFEKIEWQDKVKLSGILDIVNSVRMNKDVKSVREASGFDYLYIEFILSGKLLHSLNPAKWKVLDDNPLGYYYPITVRSYERLNDNDIRAEWAKCWRINHQKLAEPKGSCYLSTIESEKEFLPSKEVRSGKFAFKLLFKPDSRFINQLIKAGVPIALWSSQSQSINEVEEQLLSLTELLITDDGSALLSGLPEALYAYRRDNWEQSGNDYNDKASKKMPHLSSYHLLWDDPTRDPYQFERDAESPSSN